MVWTKERLLRSPIFAMPVSLVFPPSAELPVALNSRDALGCAAASRKVLGCVIEGTFWGSQAGRCSSSGGSAPPSRMFWALPLCVVCPGWDGELCASDAFGVGRLSLQCWPCAAPSTSTARCCLLVGCQKPVAGAWSLERGDEEEGVCPEHFPKAFCNQSKTPGSLLFPSPGAQLQTSAYSLESHWSPAASGAASPPRVTSLGRHSLLGHLPATPHMQTPPLCKANKLVT